MLLVACGARTELDATPRPVNDATASCGHAVQFKHSGDDVYLAGINAVPPSGFTWDFWFDATSLPASSQVDIRQGATMLLASDLVGCEDIYVGFGSEFGPANELELNVDGYGQCGARDMAPLATPEPFTTDRWYFVAVSHDYGTGESRLYIDGVVVASKTSQVMPIPRTMPVILGRWTTRGTTQYDYNQFLGTVDELHLYDRVLTDAEVARDYGGGAGRYASANDPGLLAGYHFDEGSGATAHDASGSHTGTLEGTTAWVDGFVCSAKM